jgi:phosphoribosylaminoimidazolecarboxamide formyltransferase/IMP cyclohydrolase
LSAFGGIIGLNQPIDVSTATAIVRPSSAVVAAVTPEAAAILHAKPNMRVVTGDFTIAASGRAHTREVRSILGAILVQRRDEVTEAREEWPSAGLKVVTRRQPTAEEWQALRFAWRVMAHVKSNTVIFTDRHRTRAIGAGQMSRVDAVNIATMKAGGWRLTAERLLAGTVARRAPTPVQRCG